MTTPRTTLELATDVLKKLKAEVTSSHDIISRVKLPFLFADQFENYKKQFGEEKFADYMRHIEKSDRVRNKALDLQAVFIKRGIPSPDTTMYVAITQCGVGECGDTSNRAAMELLLAVNKKLT